MSELVNPKPEFKRRFYLYNMDSLEVQNLYGKTKAVWKDEYRPLVAKLIRNPVNWKLFNDLLEKQTRNEAEVSRFNMKSKLNDLFTDDIPDNQKGLPEYKYNDLVFD